PSSSESRRRRRRLKVDADGVRLARRQSLADAPVAKPLAEKSSQVIAHRASSREAPHRRTWGMTSTQVPPAEKKKQKIANPTNAPASSAAPQRLPQRGSRNRRKELRRLTRREAVCVGQFIKHIQVNLRTIPSRSSR
ncbi:MAG: hypothetical protein KDA61_07235, partial [Planctomycetales bacterium]|nr:hypothetical protein [Planctomycetales bacterium]